MRKLIIIILLQLQLLSNAQSLYSFKTTTVQSNEISIISFKNGTQIKNQKVDDKFQFRFDKDQLSRLDSLVVYYSFYTKRLFNADLDKNLIDLPEVIESEEIVLIAKKPKFYGPEKKKASTTTFLAGNRSGILFPTDTVRNFDLRGFRIFLHNRNFLSSKPSYGVRYQFEIVAFDSIGKYGKPVYRYEDENIYKVSQKKRHWFQVKVDDTIWDEVLKHAYFAILFKPLDVNLIVGHVKRDIDSKIIPIGYWSHIDAYPISYRSPTNYRIDLIYNDKDEFDE
ncbi:hypothetical protein JCM19297_1641 [Nonlabens ulvanivorans]|nr:hypothetical protein [Nonlabens ulvanivorans]GAK91689.1 hypothetical protein JCM19297_1641 [Nonlabens ulvanivorans]